MPHPGEEREAPYAGEVFQQHDLLATLKKFVETEQQALAKGKSRKEAAEAANVTSYQMRSSFGEHESRPGRLTLNESVPPPWTRVELINMGYRLNYQAHTSGPINAIFFDREHGTMWGGSSNYGEDYGIAW